MAQQTKNAIRRAFIQLLNERSLDKISIKDIAEKGAVNRNTFYYYYADIYALVEDILQLEIEDFQSKLRRYDSWQEAFRDATAFATQNKRAVYHLYNSGNQETIRRYYHKVTLAAMTSYVRDQAEGLPVDDEDIRVLSEFYAAALSGLTALWLQNGMKYDTDAYIDHLGHLLETGTTEEIFEHPIHPYTRSLLSAIPLPNPVVEKRRVAETYDYATSGIDYTKGTSHHVEGSHYVKCTDDEFAQWCK